MEEKYHVHNLPLPGCALKEAEIKIKSFCKPSCNNWPSNMNLLPGAFDSASFSTLLYQIQSASNLHFSPLGGRQNRKDIWLTAY